MKYTIDEVSFENNGQYLDIVINNNDKYITLKLDNNEFNIDEKDWKFLKNKIDELFKKLK